MSKKEKAFLSANICKNKLKNNAPTVQSINRILRNQATTGDFYDRGPVYLFSNENVSGYMSGLLRGIKDANVLTVCASGDHAFEALLAGASHVDMFDINSAQFCVAELKAHMIRDVDYENFMAFFFSKNDFFDRRIISDIKDRFSNDLKAFMARYEKIGRDMFRYRGSHSNSYDVYKMSYISNPKNYYLLRDKLGDSMVCQTSDLLDVPEKFPYKYDLITLSNIIDYHFPYAGGMEERWKLFYRHILLPLTVKNLVSSNGKICFEYLWGVRFLGMWAQFVSQFEYNYVHKSLNKTHHTFSTYSFDSMERKSNTDMVVILHQNQKQK